MRTRSSSTQSEGSLLPGHGGRSAGGGGGGFHGRLQKLFRKPNSHDSSKITSTSTSTMTTTTNLITPISTDRPRSPSGPKEPQTPVILTFEENLQQKLFSEASRQLIEREERLFAEAGEAERLRHEEEEEEEANSLTADYKALEELVLQTLQQSLALDSGEVSAEALASAVKAVYQEDEQDQLWKKRERRPPGRRPRGWRELHDTTLRSLVEQRVDNHSTPPANQVQQSSVEAHVCSMGRRLMADLQAVVGVVKTCYPADVNICDLYARMFHQTVSARVRQLADFGLEDKDCMFLLRWVNEYYPEFFQRPELAREISAEPLGKLLPEELLKPLEEQYLSSKQSELMTYIRRVLDGEKEKWNKGEEPEREDGCYDSPVAYDIIQVINGMVTSAEKVVGDQRKAQSMTCQLDTLMHSFKTFQDEVVKKNRHNSGAIIKANLGSVQQFTDVLHRNGHLFQEDVRGNCLQVLTHMKESAHTYLLSAAHKALKPHYCKLGTSEWLKMRAFEKLLLSLQTQSEHLRGSKESCHQELIGRFHREVTVEYVQRLLRGGVKLKDKEEQSRGCAAVKDNAESLHELFIKAGSKEHWLKDVLTMIAEVLNLQDLHAIQMQVASLGSAFPDLSEKHVSALLKLKTNICRADRKTVKETLSFVLSETAVAGSRSFFSKVQMK